MLWTRHKTGVRAGGPAVCALAVTLLAAGMGNLASGAQKARPSKDPVRRAVESAAASGRLDAATANRYIVSYKRSVRLAKRLSVGRRLELGYVIRTLQRIAARGNLSVDRMFPLFLTLQRNREWWGRYGAPPSGTRTNFGDSPLIFQYYPAHGLQIQPLANCAAANALWRAKRDERLRALVDDLLAIRVTRSGFTAWEYYFDFGGGAPPWVSGMTQGTAMQALARASNRLKDPSLLQAAEQGRGVFERNTPVGARVPTEGGAWYALYSFDPKLEVLNGMLQALVGLDTYVSLSSDQRAKAAFDEGDRVAQARISAYDTGAWSLYSRSGGRPGAEADLNYHKLNRDFARNLCKATQATPYCAAADNFTRYLSEQPELRPLGAAPSPATAGKTVRFHFTLSKVGRVGITVKDADAGVAGRRARAARTYLSTSLFLRRGKRFFSWVPPRRSGDRTYEFRLFARDLAGNSRLETGTVDVKGVGAR